MIGDTESNYLEVCANYDAALERAAEMAVAIGGQRAAERQGGWRDRSGKQAKMLGWDLESFAKDELNVEIMTRPLLPWTVDDETAVKKGRAEVAVVVGDFVSKRQQLREFGIEDVKEQDKIFEEISGEDVELDAEKMEAMAVAKGGDAGGGSPQAIDPNLIGNATGN